MRTINIRDIKVGSEIGRRVLITEENNMLAVDIQRDFLAPFQEEWDDTKALGDYVGLGKFLGSLSRLAAYKQDDALTELRNNVINQIIALQAQDGYWSGYILLPE